MQLILWRHAQAADGGRDLERELTAKGRKQAARVAAWLRPRLPEDVALFASPAVRARQTAEALGVEIRIADRLAPGASVNDVLETVAWPEHGATATLVVGHQPTLGRVAAQLLTGSPVEWSVRKGGVWWLEQRLRGGRTEVVVRAVMAPDLV